MDAIASDRLLRPVYEACIAGYDSDKERRPYHRNCGCALHSSRHSHCSNAMAKSKSVSYPIRRSWSEGSLALAASGYSSPSSSPLVGKSNAGVNLSDDEDDVAAQSFRI